MWADLATFVVDLSVAFLVGYGLNELVGYIRRFGGGGSDGPGRWRAWSPRTPRPGPHGGRAVRRPLASPGRRRARPGR